MFLSRLYVRDTPTQDIWVLAQPLEWLGGEFGTITAPAGMTTDLASIPRALRNIPGLDPDGASRRAAVCHDFLYDREDGRMRGKDFADRFLRAALIAEGMSEITADAFYIAVRDFGLSAWNAWSIDAPLLDP